MRIGQFSGSMTMYHQFYFLGFIAFQFYLCQSNLMQQVEHSQTAVKIRPWGEFTQYPFFVRFRPFFYVFASSWKSMRFFIRIFKSPYPH